MEIICKKEFLLECINIVQKAVSSKTTLPMLEGILLEANEKLKLTGNDLEIGIESSVDALIKEKGSVVLNSKMFGDIVRRMPDSEVFIKVEDEYKVIIECGNSHFELKGINPEGFPLIPTIEKKNTFRISQKLMRDMIKQTIFAVSIDENRPIFMGLLIECHNKELCFVSVDGFRVALRKSIIKDENICLSVVVPGKTLSELAKILQPIDDEIIIYSTKNQIMFDMQNCKVTSRLLEGEFLNYKNIIPKEFETRLRISKKEILSSIERASLITMEEKKYPVKFDVTSDNVMIFSNTTLGAVRENLKVEVEGRKINIGFNPRYFIDALKVIEDEEIDILFTSDIGPCTIKPIEGDNYAYMILPVRIKKDENI